MIKRIYLLCMMCVLATGCAQHSPPIITPWQGQNLEILALIATRPLDADVRLSINGDPVISKTIVSFEGATQNIAGVWRGQRITARVSRNQNAISSATRMDVFINGNLVEVLRL